jgi:translation elongation factor EF-1alpha
MSLRSTREHILTAYLQGCRSLVVAVNKMEQTVWSKARFDELRHRMWSICQRTGYASERVRIVPISGCMEGDNVFVESKHMRGWYTGPTLLQALGDVIQALPVRAEANIHRLMAMARKPLCLVVHRCRRMSADNKRLLEVSVVQGRVSVGDKLALPILGLEGLEVLSMERCLKAINTAKAPFDRVNLAVRLVDHPSDKTSAGYLNQAKYLRRGAVLTKALGQADGKAQPPPPLRRVQSLVAEIIVFNHPNGIRHGYMPTAWFHTLNVRCSLRLLSKLDRSIK